MGKKIKKKAPIPGKVKHRASAGSPKSVLQGSSPNIGSVTNGDRDKEACNHCAKSTIELNWILLKIRPSSMDVVACEHCRRGGKEKIKNPKRKGLGTRAPDAKSNQNFMWVCLDCGQYFCGGEVSMLEPYGHARRHGKQERHQWTVRADNPLISWCYSCSSSVPIQLPQEVITEENKETINDGCVNWSVNTIETFGSEKLKGYNVRGLSNLGNTCFFNSVVQNFFSMDLLRDALLGLDRPVGPLSMALRMLFVETSADSKGVVNPKALFGCICAKAPQFRSYQQQDSHELLCYLLDGLQMEETNARKTSGLCKDQGKINVETGDTLVEAIFGGCLSSTVSCMECGHTSVVNEPFLDLSLPVPSRKSPSKKLPPLKKSNQRDKNKTRRFREMAVVQVSTMSVCQKVENNAQPSECSESEIVVPKQTHVNTSEAPEFTWMDYLGGDSPNCNYSGLHEFEASEVQCSWSNHAGEIESSAYYVSELHKESETYLQSVSELRIETGCNAQSCNAQSFPEFHTADCSNDLTVYSDTSVERSCNDAVPESCIPVPGVILLSYKEQGHDFIGLDANNRTSFFQDPDATNHIDNFISVPSDANSTCKQVEDDFDGFSDLFNEPEATSDLKEDNIASVTLWNGNIAVSTLKEVDDTNAPVSIYSCLALFTTPELLCDEQAWYCENCSKLLMQEDKEHGASIPQAAKVSDQPVTVKSMVNEDEFLSSASNSHCDSAIEKVLDNGKSASSPKNITLVEDNFDQIVVINTSHEPIITAEGSQNNEESNINENLHLAETVPCSSLACLLDVLDKEMLDSETSQYFSTPPAAVNSPIQDGESTFNGINGRSSVGNDEKEPEVTSHSWQSCTNIALQKSSEDSSKEVGRGRKKGLKSGNAHPPNKNKGEGIKMVKRDATKRILIDKIPRILTIHLKRFSQDGRGRISKLSGHVRFQETLDMRPFMDPRCIKDRTDYHLIGVVEHSGTMGGGHYVAYVQGNGRGSRASTGSSSTGTAWFYVSDAYVREVSLADVLQSEAYILFYEKM